MKKLVNPVPHPHKARLKSLKISQALLAFNLKISPMYLCRLLGGQAPMSKHVDAEIAELLATLEKDLEPKPKRKKKSMLNPEKELPIVYAKLSGGQ